MGQREREEEGTGGSERERKGAEKDERESNGQRHVYLGQIIFHISLCKSDSN